MARIYREHIERVIEQAKSFLTNVSVLRYDIGKNRAIIDLQGNWKEYRIIVSEIHRINRGVRYAYYVLDQDNKVVNAFDNSTDVLAIKQKYGSNWKSNINAEIPHQHDSEGNITLTPVPVNFKIFMKWLNENL